MKNFPLDAVGVQQTVPNGGTPNGVQFSVPPFATDVYVYNSFDETLYLRSGNDTVNVAAASLPMEIPAKGFGTFGLNGATRVAARYATNAHALTLWFAVGS